MYIFASIGGMVCRSGPTALFWGIDNFTLAIQAMLVFTNENLTKVTRKKQDNTLKDSQLGCS